MSDTTPSTALKRTPLHDLHVALGAKMVPFAGFEMPVTYPAGIGAEHRAVRERVGVFDVSHMGEFEVTGPDRNAFVQRVTCNDVATLRTGQAQYSGILTEQGTFVDDCLVYRFDDKVMLVVNASNIAKDWEHIVAQKGGANVRLRDISDETALLAIQGPNAEALVAALSPVAVAQIPYYHFTSGTVAGAQCFISRTGYTGEDGFEVYGPADAAPKIWNALIEAGRPKGLLPAGLGARDTLRLEAKLALYGNDIDDAHTPWEADLGWIVKMKKGDFTGRDALAKQKEAGITRRLVGFEVTGRGIARHGFPVSVDPDSGPVGVVTSGTQTPTVGKPIGLAYVPTGRATPGTPLAIDVRGRSVAARVVPTPFYKRKT